MPAKTGACPPDCSAQSLCPGAREPQTRHTSPSLRTGRGCSENLVPGPFVLWLHDLGLLLTRSPRPGHSPMDGGRRLQRAPQARTGEKPGADLPSPWGSREARGCSRGSGILWSWGQSMPGSQLHPHAGLIHLPAAHCVRAPVTSGGRRTQPLPQGRSPGAQATLQPRRPWRACEPWLASEVYLGRTGQPTASLIEPGERALSGIIGDGPLPAEPASCNLIPSQHKEA